MDFAVNGVEAGTASSELALERGQQVKVTLKAAANLDALPNDIVRTAAYDVVPYWDLERARIGTGREVSVQIIVNGAVAATQPLVADGVVRDLSFDVRIDRSSWIAARILPSSHTNPVFALVEGKPIRASRESVQWCLTAVNQCWTQKAPKIRANEIDAARQAYDHARRVYTDRLAEVGR
jgi:hypothetical protein